MYKKIIVMLVLAAMVMSLCFGKWFGMSFSVLSLGQER